MIGTARHPQRRGAFAPFLIAGVLAAVALAGCVPAPAPAPPTATNAPSTVASSAPAPSEPAPPAASATPTSYPFDLATFPALDGSTANIPLGSLILQRLVGVPKAQADNVSFSNTSNAYVSLACDDPANYANGLVVLAYEPAEVTKKDLADCAKLEFHPIGRDALVFLANQKNPVTSLTTKQYKDIYSGKITNWSDVGGAAKKIVAFQRPEPSGSQALLRKFVMGNAKMAKAPTEIVTAEMGELIDGVANYNNSGNALGYSVFYYAKAMYAQPGVKLLGANGVAPSSATIADGSYPYVNDFYAAIRADEPQGSVARQVVAWLESPEGQQTVVDAGYVGKA